MDKSRRNFIFGNFRKVIDRSSEIINNRSFILRPPGAVSEKRFIKLCEPGCFDCLQACPHQVILKSNNPMMDANTTAFIDTKIGGCEYCSEFPCIDVCKTGALGSKNRIMGKAELLASCITKQHQICDMCRYSCPDGYQALDRDKYGRLQVDLEKCVGCGKCVNACFMVPKSIEIFSLEKMMNRKVVSEEELGQI